MAAGFLAVLGLGGAALAQDAIQQRREGLRGMGQQMEAIKAVSDSRGDPRPLVARIDGMLTFFQGFPARFPTGSDSGDTRALPAVWSDRATFEKAAADMVTQLQALRVVAAAGDPAALPAAFQQTGTTCGACHRDFRARAR